MELQPIDDLGSLNAPLEWLFNATVLMQTFDWHLAYIRPGLCHDDEPGLAWYGESPQPWMRCVWHATPWCLWLPN